MSARSPEEASFRQPSRSLSYQDKHAWSTRLRSVSDARQRLVICVKVVLLFWSCDSVYVTLTQTGTLFDNNLMLGSKIAMMMSSVPVIASVISYVYYKWSIDQV